MIDFDNYAIWGCLLLAVVCIIATVRIVFHKRKSASETRFIRETLQQAMDQDVTFDIKIPGAAGSGFSGRLSAVRGDKLTFKGDAPPPDGFNRKGAEVYFRITHDQEPVFFVFNSSVLRMDARDNLIELSIPDHLRVEKKRHFNRIKPPAQDIRMLAVWQVPPGRRLPRTNSDLGAPAISWKQGQAAPNVHVENIAGSGIALKFTPEEEGPFPLNLLKGRQLICLLVFVRDETAQKPVIFWCSGEIMNIRQAGESVAVGLEFINWAVQEPGETEIHWVHNSPWRGVKPIIQWVRQLEQH